MTDLTLLALLARVCANPADDAPRLVMADRLDELEEHTRAELIREMIREFGDDEYALKPAHWTFPRGNRAFREAHGRPLNEWEAATRPRFSLHIPDLGLPNPELAGWCRGFVRSLTLSAADLLRVGDALLWDADGGRACPVGAQPVEEVTLTTWPEVECVTDVPAANSVRLRGRPTVLAYLSRCTVEDARQYRLDHPGAGLLEAKIRLMTPHLLRAEWPSVKTWNMPPEPVVGEWVGLRQYSAGSASLRALAGVQTDEPPYDGAFVDEADDPAEGLSPAPPDNARRRAGHSRMPAWLAEQRGRLGKRQGRRLTR